jgi:hypothetical protein
MKKNQNKRQEQKKVNTKATPKGQNLSSYTTLKLDY